VEAADLLPAVEVVFKEWVPGGQIDKMPAVKPR
jgi:hypothetical protein